MTNPDTVSIDAVIQAMYESISGRAGEPRQWERDRALHHPKALLVPARQASGGPGAGVFDFDGFVASRAPYLDATDFYEVEIGRREFRFGAIAHVLSFYEARAKPDGGLLRRGVNSIQLMHGPATEGIPPAEGNAGQGPAVPERWWILSTVWDNEREGVTLPDPLE